MVWVPTLLTSSTPPPLRFMHVVRSETLQNKQKTKTKRTKQNCKHSETETFSDQNRVTRILLPLHVNTVGIRDVNMRNRSEKNKQPVLLKTLLPSLPMPWYRSPMRRPTDAVDTKRRWVKIRSLKMDCAALLNNTRNCRQKRLKIKHLGRRKKLPLTKQIHFSGNNPNSVGNHER